MIYQKKPFKSHNMVGLLHKIKHENVLFPPNYQNQSLINLCSKLLNKKEIERPSTELIMTYNNIYDSITKNNFQKIIFQKNILSNLHACKYDKLINFKENFTKIKNFFFTSQKYKTISTQTNISIPSYMSYKYTLSSLNSHH